MNNNPHISIISPVYEAEGIIDELVRRVCESVESITDNYEFILIEDNSPDNSWASIQRNCQQNAKVKGVKLSRNFGQHNAISAGMELASGDYVVLLDCDLQHDPKYIPEMYRKMEEGYDLIYTQTKTRKHGFIKNISAKFYYQFLKFISDFDMDLNIGSFSMLTRKVVDGFNQYNDYRKAYLWALQWAGYNSFVLPIEHNERFAGKSSYTSGKLLVHAFNVAIANSNKLLYLSVYLGLGTSLFATAAIVFIIARYFIIGGLQGWTSSLVVMMFFSGLILTSIGVVGIYIGKIFEQVKNRPRYLISEKTNI